MYPDEYLKKMYKSISFQVKITFVSSIIIGLLIHFFMITNLYPNYDTTSLYDDSRWLIISGRWFLFVALFLTHAFLIPWIDGLLAIIFLAISVCIVIKCLDIKNYLYCILISGLMVSFPTITSFLLYMFGIPGTMLSLLFVCFAVYLTHKFRYGFLGGIIFIALSLGIYQAYFPFAAGLSVTVLILDIIKTNSSFKNIVIKAIKLLFMLLLGVIVYFIIVKLSLIITNNELTSYKGINEMGKITFSMLLGLIKEAYKNIITFFIHDSYGAHKFSEITFPLLIILSTILLLIIIIQKRLMEKKQFFILVLLIILFPLACNSIYVMVPNAGIHLLMRYGMVLFPIAIIMLMEIIEREIYQKEYLYLIIFKQTVCWIITIILLFNIYNYGILANKLYTKAHIVYEQGYAYSVELVTRIESAEGYKKDIPIMIVGSPGSSISQLPEFQELNFTGSTNNLTSAYSYWNFIHTFLGIKLNILIANQDNIEKYNLDKELKKMPLYPEYGSIKQVNDILVVNFSSPQIPIKKNLIPDSGLPIPNSTNMVIQQSYDIINLDIIDNAEIVVQSGNTDPQLYISLQNAIEKPSVNPFIEITYTNTVPGILQIFYDYGYGLSEEKSKKQILDASLVEKTIQLPVALWLEGQQLVGFRLDPPNHTEFTILNIRFP